MESNCCLTNTEPYKPTTAVQPKYFSPAPATTCTTKNEQRYQPNSTKQFQASEPSLYLQPCPQTLSTRPARLGFPKRRSSLQAARACWQDAELTQALGSSSPEGADNARSFCCLGTDSPTPLFLQGTRGPPPLCASFIKLLSAMHTFSALAASQRRAAVPLIPPDMQCPLPFHVEWSLYFGS